MYTLFHDKPAKCADYISITESKEFPFSFCASDWVEDKRVADRVVEL